MNFRSVLTLCLGLHYVESTVWSTKALPDVLIASNLDREMARLVSGNNVPYENENENDSSDYFHRIRHIVGNETVYSSEILHGRTRDAVYDEIEDCIYYNIVSDRWSLVGGFKEYFGNQKVLRRCKSTEFKTVETIDDWDGKFSSYGQMSFDWIGRNLIEVHSEENGIEFLTEIAIKSLKSAPRTAYLTMRLDESLKKDLSRIEIPVYGTLVVDSESNYVFYVTKRSVIRCDLRDLDYAKGIPNCSAIETFGQYIVKMEANLAKKELVLMLGSAKWGVPAKSIRVIQMTYNGTRLQEWKFDFHTCREYKNEVSSMLVHDDFVYWTEMDLDTYEAKCNGNYENIPTSIFGASLTEGGERRLFYSNDEDAYITWMRTTEHSGKQLNNRCEFDACDEKEICLASHTSDKFWENRCLDPTSSGVRKGKPVPGQPIPTELLDSEDVPTEPTVFAEEVAEEDPIFSSRVLPDVLIANSLTAEKANELRSEGVPFEEGLDHTNSNEAYHRIHHIVGNEAVYSSEILRGQVKAAFYDENTDCIYYDVFQGKLHVLKRCKSSGYKTAEKITHEFENGFDFDEKHDLSFDWIGRNLISVHNKFGGEKSMVSITSLENIASITFRKSLQLEAEAVAELNNYGTLTVDSEAGYIFYSMRRTIIRCSLHDLTEDCKPIHYNHEAIIKMEAIPEIETLYFMMITNNSLVKLMETDYDGSYLKELRTMPYNKYPLAEKLRELKFRDAGRVELSLKVKQFYLNRKYEGITSMFVHDDFVYWTDTWEKRNSYIKGELGPMSIYGASLTNKYQEPHLFYQEKDGVLIRWMKTTAHSGKLRQDRCETGACEKKEICIASSSPERGWENNCLDSYENYSKGRPVHDES